MNGRDDLDRMVAALRPWLDELVLVGGWAHRLHHDHPLASRQPYQPVRTRDADLVFNTRAKLSGKISEALAQGGFREDLSTDERPPVAQYVLDSGEDGFFAEFLTPLTGGRTRRDGRGVATVARSGITAQRLRHLEVLLVAPWPVSVGGDGSASLPMKTAI